MYQSGPVRTMFTGDLGSVFLKWVRRSKLARWCAGYTGEV